MSVNVETFGDFSLGESFLDVADTRSQSATLVGGEGDDGFTVEVDVFEEGEHYLRVGAPPNGTADKDGVVGCEVGSRAFVGRQLAVGCLFLGQIDKGHVGHAVILVGDDFVLVGPSDFADVVSHDFGVADFNVADGLVVAGV